MADKDFKVKTGLDLPAPLPLSEGGTGQTSAENTRNALMPVQTGHSGKFITTDGTGMSWAVAPQQTATDGAAGYKVYAGNTTPTGQSTGDIWIDASTGNGIQLVRWRKTIASSGSTITGLDDNNLTLSYTAGNEQVYINGTLITRGQDYTATNGTSISLTQALEVGDTVEIFGNPLFSVTDTYTQAQADSRYVNYSGLNAAGKNLIINGGFDIWQRGTTVSNASHNTYTADQWININDGVGTTNVSQIDISSQAIGLRYAARYEKTSGASNRFVFINLAEGALNCVGKQVTLSFWLRKGPALTSGITASIGTRANKYGTVYDSGDFGIANSEINSTTFTRFTRTFTVTSATANNSANLFELEFTAIQAGGTGVYFEVAGVQLEVGSVATHFSRAGGNIQGELAACQRYFQRFGNSVAYEPFGVAHGIDVNNARMYLPLKVNMRTNPTFSSTAASTFQKSFGTTSGLSTIALGASSNHAVSIDFSRTSEFTANGGFIISSVAAGNAYIDLSAEI